MDGLFAHASDLLVGRTTGPLHFRLVLQPAMAAFLAVRAGLADARQGRPAFGWDLLVGAGHRRDLLREGWNDIAVLFLLAFALDAAYQIITFRWVYLVQALVVAALVAVPIYVLLRGPTNRVARLAFFRRK